VTLVGPLPQEFELATVYTAAVCARTAAPEAARRLVKEFLTDDRRNLRKSAGFES
jgi:molybdate transport system substrate-binding protein